MNLIAFLIERAFGLQFLLLLSHVISEKKTSLVYDILITTIAQ